MDPIAITIVAALTAGATAGASAVATSAIKDAYTGLKRLIADTYAGLSPLVELAEKDPNNIAIQETLAAQVVEQGGSADPALRSAATKVLDAVEAAPQVAALIDVEKLTALKKFEISNIELVGGLIKVTGEARFDGEVSIRDVKQKSPEEKNG